MNAPNPAGIPPNDDSESGSVADLESALNRMRGDEKLLVELIGFFLEDLPSLTMSMQQGADSGDMPTLERSAHSLKGLAANFDAHRVIAAAREVELAAKLRNADQAKGQLPKLVSRSKELAAHLQTYLDQRAS